MSGFSRPRSPFSGGSVTAIVLVLLALAPASASAAEYFIEMFSGAFLPQSHQIQAGDTVTWVWVAGTHVVTSGLPGGPPGTIDEPGALFSGSVDALNPTFSHVFPGPVGSVNFHDANSPAQIGFIQVLGDDLTFDVHVLDNVYEPQAVEIFKDDSVRWVHEPGEMLHTVTSGLSSDPLNNPGALFNAISSDAQPIFVFEFDSPGDFPYFCVPHELLGMIGLVRVQDKFVRADANRDGSVDVGDAITILGVLFQMTPADSCEDASDANDDETVDIADAVWTLAYLFSGGPTPPAPFPTEGPDRTGMGLFCWP